MAIPFEPLRFTRAHEAFQALRRQMIEEAAYFLAQKRNFAPGHEHEDWIVAETTIDRLLDLDRE
jgi:hypothetical protein